MDIIEIPEKYRMKHSSGTRKPSRTSGANSASENGFYCWQSFGGYVHYVATVTAEKPKSISIYVNGSLHQSFSGSQISEAVTGKSVYKVIFSGLKYGDKFYTKAEYSGGSVRIDERVYIGCRKSEPDISETSTRINASADSPYDENYSMSVGVVTFGSDYGDLNKYSRDARTLLVESCLQCTEYDSILGKVSNEGSITLEQYDPVSNKWIEPSVYENEGRIYKFENLSTYNPIKVGITSSSSSNYYSYFSNYVDAWIADFNTLLGGVYAVRNDAIKESDYGIRITLGTHDELFGYDPDDSEYDEKEVMVYYGQWDRTLVYVATGTSGTYHCEVKLCNEIRGAMTSESDFRNITYEELTECLGCGNDTFRVFDSMFSEMWYVGKSNNLFSGNKPTPDGEVVQMLYKELNIGDTISELAHRLTPSEACVVKLPCFKWANKKNCSYTVKPYAMNRKVTWHTNPKENTSTVYWWFDYSDNSYSDIGDELSITPAYDTPIKAPRVGVYDRGADYLKADVGDERTYDLKAVDSSGNEVIVYEAEGPKITVSNLSPTTEYAVYSKISGTSAWFGGYSATTCPSKPRIHVYHSGTSLSIKVTAPETGKYTYLEMDAGYYQNGEQKYITSQKITAGTEYKYTVDAGSRFYVYAWAVYTVGSTDLRSEYAYENGYIGLEKASNPTGKRIDGGLIIDWNTTDTATRYQAKLVRVRDGKASNIFCDSPPCTFTGLDYGESYKISIDTYDGKWLGFGDEEPITTAPAQPVINSITRDKGVITVDWKLAAESNISKVYINLYTVSGSLLQQRTFENTKSGVFSFDAVTDGYYTVKASSMLAVGSTEIFSVDSEGNEFKLEQSVHISSRPGYFYWSDYTSHLSSGQKISLTPYAAWNALIDNIKEVLTFTDKGDTLMPESVVLYGNASGKTFLQACDYAYIPSENRRLYAATFNVANYILSWFVQGTGVGSKYGENAEYKVLASDLIALQEAINSIVE